MSEYSFELVGGEKFEILGDLISKTTETSEFLAEKGPTTTVCIYKTENHGFLATIDYRPGPGNQKRGHSWTGFVPDRQRPKTISMDDLKLEFESDLSLGTFPDSVMEDHVKQAVGKLFPPSGPTVID
jgi:hypothetical protein